MDKSMYSLILIDEVVKKVDALAHTRGTSRSNLVNQILADYVSYLTPQKKVEEIFEHLSLTVRGGALQVQQSSASMLVLRSVLNYRYNPAIRYSVEITLESGHYVCELKVASRTQSDALLSRLSVFYEIWTQIESGMLRDKLEGELRSAMSAGRFRRWLLLERDDVLPNSRLLGKVIGDYIRLFDSALKLSFSGEYGMDMQTYEQICNLYQKYMEDSELII